MLSSRAASTLHETNLTPRKQLLGAEQLSTRTTSAFDEASWHSDLLNVCARVAIDQGRRVNRKERRDKTVKVLARGWRRGLGGTNDSSWMEELLLLLLGWRAFSRLRGDYLGVFIELNAADGGCGLVEKCY